MIGIHLSVITPRQEHYFRLLARRAECVSDLRFPLDFYTAAGVTVTFPQWEVQILVPRIAKGQTGKLNYHYSVRDNEPYVCYPNLLPTQEALMDMLVVWVVGQACVLELDRYLNELITEAGSKEAFITWAKERGIRLGIFDFDLDK